MDIYWEAFYPTSIAGYTANEIDMLDKVLTVADSLDMKVRVGVGFNKDWWSKGAGDRAWLTREANEKAGRITPRFCILIVTAIALYQIIAMRKL